jgi:predicted TIM-barrel fold metal-dependent hydrolase
MPQGYRRGARRVNPARPTSSVTTRCRGSALTVDGRGRRALGRRVIVDSHTHVVADDEDLYPLCPYGLDQGVGTERRQAVWFREIPLTAERLLHEMDEAGVAAALLVQAMGAYSYDNAYAADAARAHRERLASVVIVDPSRDDAAASLRHWVRERGARGVRLFTVTNPEATWLDEPAGFRLLDEARTLGIPVVVTILARQVEKLASALRRFPDVPVALDHCGFPDLRGGPPYERASALFELAAFTNLRVKVTTHVLRLAEREPGGPAALTDALAARFGAARLLWGSDYPQTHDRPYGDMVALAQRAVANFDAAARARFLGGTALELWPELAAGRQE